MSAQPGIGALVASIPDEDGASLVAQVGERGRVNSRDGSVDISDTALTVAEIDSLNASIFPPDRLKTLQETGLVTFYFTLPGVEGWFTALAGSNESDRWLDVRRRKTPPPRTVRAVAEAAAPPLAVVRPPAAVPLAAVPLAAVPLAAVPAPKLPLASIPLAKPPIAAVPLAAVPAPRVPLVSMASTAPASHIAFAPPEPVTAPADEIDDFADLSSLDFPSKEAEADTDALSVSKQLYEELAGSDRVEPKDRGSWDASTPTGATLDSRRAREILCPPTRPRRWVRIGVPVVACAAVALLGVRYIGTSLPALSIGRTAPPQSQPAARKSPPPHAAVTPAAQPAARSVAVTPAPAPAPTTASAPAPTAPPPAKPATPSPTVTAKSSPAPATGSSAPAETAQATEQRRSGFSVQVAAVQARDEADRIVTRFVTRGYSAYIARGEGTAANYYRVRIGAFADRKTAEDVARQLEGSEGIKPWIAKEEGMSRR
jgi:DedD protein